VLGAARDASSVSDLGNYYLHSVAGIGTRFLHYLHTMLRIGVSRSLLTINRS